MDRPANHCVRMARDLETVMLPLLRLLYTASGQHLAS